MTLLVNGEPTPLPQPATVAALVAPFTQAGQRLAVEKNGEIVPRSLWATTPLVAGDQLELVRAIGGG